MYPAAAMADRAAIFDLDGVLMDSGAFHLEAWRRMAAELDAPFEDAFFWRTFGMTNGRILPQLLGRELHPEESRELSERKEALYRETATGSIRLWSGAEPLLEALRRAGFRLAVGSSTPRSNLDFLRAELGLDRFMDAFVCAEDVRLGKPDPEPFLVAASRLAVEPRAAVVVEDALAGVAAALAAGMRCIAVSTTVDAGTLRSRSGAHLVAGSVADLTVADFERLLGRAGD